MPSYSVTLDDVQQLALAYETERRNLLHAEMQRPEGTEPARPQTVQEVLQDLMAQQMVTLGMQARPAVEPFLGLLEATAETSREALISAIPRDSLRTFLRAHLRTGVRP